MKRETAISGTALKAGLIAADSNTPRESLSSEVSDAAGHFSGRQRLIVNHGDGVRSKDDVDRAQVLVRPVALPDCRLEDDRYTGADLFPIDPRQRGAVEKALLAIWSDDEVEPLVGNDPIDGSLHRRSPQSGERRSGIRTPVNHH